MCTNSVLRPDRKGWGGELQCFCLLRIQKTFLHYYSRLVSRNEKLHYQKRRRKMKSLETLIQKQAVITENTVRLLPQWTWVVNCALFWSWGPVICMHSTLQIPKQPSIVFTTSTYAKHILVLQTITDLWIMCLKCHSLSMVPGCHIEMNCFQRLPLKSAFRGRKLLKDSCGLNAQKSDMVAMT